MRHRSGASEAGIRILNVLLFGNIWNQWKTKWNIHHQNLSEKILRNFQLISFSFLGTELLENREFLSGILWVMHGVRKKHLATNFEFPGTEMFDKPEIPYRSFLLLFANIPLDFWLEVSWDFGQFLRRLRGNLWAKIEGFGGSLKVPGILGSFIAALLSGEDSKPTEQKAPRIPATFENQKKVPGQVSFSSSWKLALRAELGWPRLFNPPTGKKSQPRNDSSNFHSSPVQEQSNPTNPPETT
jgi:hypothetical protein